jgi:hypothetical protein
MDQPLPEGNQMSIPDEAVEAGGNELTTVVADSLRKSLDVPVYTGTPQSSVREGIEMIPEAAVEAASKAWLAEGGLFEDQIRAALEAAAPHLLRAENEPPGHTAK